MWNSPSPEAVQEVQRVMAVIHKVMNKDLEATLNKDVQKVFKIKHDLITLVLHADSVCKVFVQIQKCLNTLSFTELYVILLILY